MTTAEQLLSDLESKVKAATPGPWIEYLSILPNGDAVGGPDPICASVHQVEIFMERAGMCWEIQIRVDGRRVDRESFAKAAGFEYLGHLEDFFQNIYGLPFEGILIKW